MSGGRFHQQLPRVAAAALLLASVALVQPGRAVAGAVESKGFAVVEAVEVERSQIRLHGTVLSLDAQTQIRDADGSSLTLADLAVPATEGESQPVQVFYSLREDRQTLRELRRVPLVIRTWPDPR